MEERYAVLLNGCKIGTVRLDPDRRGSVTVRMAPLPAFRGIARHRRVLKAALEEELETQRRPDREQLAAADGAAAVLDTLRLSLVHDPDGAPVVTSVIKLSLTDPPQLRITW